MGKGNETPAKWLSTAGVAEELGVTLRTVYRFLDEGLLVGYKFGRVMRIKAADVEAFIEASRLVPGTLGHLYPQPVARQDEVEPDPLHRGRGAGHKAGLSASSVTRS